MEHPYWEYQSYSTVAQYIFQNVVSLTAYNDRQIHKYPIINRVPHSFPDRYDNYYEYVYLSQKRYAKTIPALVNYDQAALKHH